MLKTFIKQALSNFKGGFTSNRKLIVIESDDWGSIRMSSKGSFESLKSKGYKVDSCPYNKFDILESNDDIIALKSTLIRLKSKLGVTPIITLNNCTANPDFNKIRESNFQKYYWEPFTDTYKKYVNSDKVVQYIKEGIELGLFQVQYHGREHLNISRWMRALKSGDLSVQDAFEENVFSPKVSEKTGYRMEYMDALDYDCTEERNSKADILISGYQVFKKVWGQNSDSFIAPCYRWGVETELVLKELGVKYIQGQRKQFVPINKKGFELIGVNHFTGQKNPNDQIYTVRNVFFEPSMDENIDWVSKAFNEIKIAFFLNQPAIISMHRINFVGGLEKLNREKNLELFETLILRVASSYPDIEFVSSDQLGDIINKE